MLSIKDYESKKHIDLLYYDKEENSLVKKFFKCKTRKCSEIRKELLKEEKNVNKEIKKKCAKKSNNIMAEAYCADNLYNKKYKPLFNKYTKCGEKNCAKERKTLKKYTDKRMRNIQKDLQVTNKKN